MNEQDERAAADGAARGLKAAMDAYAPEEMARRVESAGVAKARLPILPLFTLSVLAGAFIALGAALYLVAVTDSGLGLGPARLLGGVAFSLGLVLVVVGGAELFTGNCLIVMAYADGLIATREILYNWIVALAGNLAGALATAFMMHVAGIAAIGDGGVGVTLLDLAAVKTDLFWGEAFMRGVLCNVLVCLAVWLCFAAHTVSGKVLCIVFPITAFVALGFEHSIANFFFLPFAALSGAPIGLTDMLNNLIPVLLGNIFGGAGLVGLVYWSVYGYGEGR